MDLNVAGSSPVDRPTSNAASPQQQTMKYKHVVLGGTFDHLHIGHTSPLRVAFEIGEQVTVGLSTSKLYQNKPLWRTIQPYKVRKAKLLYEIKTRWPKSIVTVVPINDMFGPSISNSEFDAIVVTEPLAAKAELVNEKRVKNGLKKLEVILAPQIEADDGSEMSSSRIRMGEIDKLGFTYTDLFKRTLHLPILLRSELRKPLGIVIKGSERELSEAASKASRLLINKEIPLSVAVGDVVCSSLEKVGFIPDIKIVDFKTRRKALVMSEKNIIFDVKNNSGTVDAKEANFISERIMKAIKSETKFEVRVDGEEDLLVLPAVLCAPLESVIFYGQQKLGIVMIIVTEEIKQKMKALIRCFKVGESALI